VKQKVNRLNIYTELAEPAEVDENLFKLIVTDDEAWIYMHNVETKQQSSQWKPKSSPRSKVKTMFTVFFDCQCLDHL
jgi:hypothetical protein